MNLSSSILSFKRLSGVKFLRKESLFGLRLLMGFMMIAMSLPSQAAYEGDFTPRAEMIQKIPKTLFHWASRYRVNAWAQEIQAQDQGFIFPYELKDESRFVAIWRAFAKYKGVFAWIDPVLGSQGVTHESYSFQADLMMFKIKPGAKAVRLISDGSYRKDQSKLIKKAGINIEDIQLIEHITPNIHEWIIVDHKAVQDFTADPKVTYPEAWESLQPYLQDPDYRPPFSKIHYRYEKSKRPVWISNPNEPKSTWNLSVMIMNILGSFAVNKESPYYNAELAEDDPYNSFKKPLAKIMKRNVPLKCSSTVSNRPELNWDSVMNRLGEYRNR